MHMIGKDGGATLFGCSRHQLFLQVMTVEDVVAQYKSAGV